MVRRSHVIFLGLLCLSAAIRFNGQQTRGAQTPAAEVRTIPMSLAAKIPVTTLKLRDATAGSDDPARPAVWPGAADEPPEGPDGFNLLPDGGLIITDPLRASLSIFSREGNYRASWKIGFAADSIVAVADGFLTVREADTGRLIVLDNEGRPAGDKRPVSPALASAKLLSPTSGVIAPTSSGDHAPIEVSLNKPGLSLLSLEGLGVDEAGDTYVALETTRKGAESEGVDVSKFVRKYSRDGRLLGESSELPLDYFVTPVDELRVVHGVVYQLMTTPTEIRINSWNMN